MIGKPQSSSVMSSGTISALSRGTGVNHGAALTAQRPDAARSRQARLLGQAEIALIFLRGMQPEYGVQAVEQGTQICQVRIVGRACADVIKQLAKSADLMADLRVAAA